MQDPGKLAAKGRERSHGSGLEIVEIRKGCAFPLADVEAAAAAAAEALSEDVVRPVTVSATQDFRKRAGWGPTWPEASNPDRGSLE